MEVKDQIITENYSIYNGDCYDVVSAMPNNSIDLACYSPPFCGLYNYSSSERDFSNCESKEQFLEMYAYLIEQMGARRAIVSLRAMHTRGHGCRLGGFGGQASGRARPGRGGRRRSGEQRRRHCVSSCFAKQDRVSPM